MLVTCDCAAAPSAHAPPDKALPALCVGHPRLVPTHLPHNQSGCTSANRHLFFSLAAGPQGPFGSAATAGISPGVLAALTPQLTQADAAAGGQQQAQLVGYVPPQLISLLRELVSKLTADTQLGAVDGVSCDVVASALQVGRALH